MKTEILKSEDPQDQIVKIGRLDQKNKRMICDWFL